RNKRDAVRPRSAYSKCSYICGAHLHCLSMDGYRRVSSRIRRRRVSKHIHWQTQTSESQHASGPFADMILQVMQAANSIQSDPMRRVSRYHLVPNIQLIGENTGNTYYEWAMAFGLQTDAGGEAISARARERSLLSNRIESFTKLPKDWGGENTILVDQQTLDFAKRLVRELPEKWPLPQATTSPDGEIAFTWFKGGNRL